MPEQYRVQFIDDAWLPEGQPFVLCRKADDYTSLFIGLSFYDQTPEQGAAILEAAWAAARVLVPMQRESISA